MSKADLDRALHILVEGRVQGVGYRRFAQKLADSLQVSGWARNLLDGRVEIFAEGLGDKLDAFCEGLKKGPSFARVAEIIARSVEPTSVLGFEIKKDEEWK